MIEADKRNAIFTLHREGVSLREISSQLRLSRNTVRKILKSSSEAAKPRTDRIEVDRLLLERLYGECEGWLQRVHEKLTAEHGIDIGYSTLTRLIRDYQIGRLPERRHDRVPDEPGSEMQHDTSPYKVALGGTTVPVIASLLYYRYCKQRYLKFYRAFNRFQMKGFFHEALTYYGYAAKICVIDNTNLAVLHGTGKNAVFVPEMEAFAKDFGDFKWLAHEKGHSDRKAGEERSFWTVETNFFPGRKFSSLEDLNEQARHWALEILSKRPQTRARIIPAEWFEQEKPYLTRLSRFIPEPYLDHPRGVDQYGYAHFDGNDYWVPGQGREDVTVLQYAAKIHIYRKREFLIEYPLPPWGTRNKKVKPKAAPDPDGRPPSAKPSAADVEEEKLRALAPEISAFIDLALQAPKMRGQRPRFIRELYRLQSRMARTLFIQTVTRAATYRVSDIKAIERIALFLMRDELFDAGLPEAPAKFQNRELYRQGRLSADPDLSVYQKLLDPGDSIEQEMESTVTPEVHANRPATTDDDSGASIGGEHELG